MPARNMPLTDWIPGILSRIWFSPGLHAKFEMAATARMIVGSVLYKSSQVVANFSSHVVRPIRTALGHAVWSIGPNFSPFPVRSSNKKEDHLREGHWIYGESNAL